MKRLASSEAKGAKLAPIMALFTMATLIFLAGAVFSVISVVWNVSIPVMGSQINGAVWGIVMMFLGVRYLLSVQKLKAEITRQSAQFSWSSFKSDKARQRQQQHSNGK